MNYFRTVNLKISKPGGCMFFCSKKSGDFSLYRDILKCHENWYPHLLCNRALLIYSLPNSGVCVCVCVCVCVFVSFQRKGFS